MKQIPNGIKVLSWATGVRWFGWGFVEALIPIFLYQFTQDYLSAGLLTAAYYVSFLLFLPFAGALGDRTSARTLVLIGLLLYPIIGLGYVLAGVFGSVSLVIAARFLNGPAYALDVVGRNTYIRRHARRKIIATTFGYFDTVSNFWWVAALLLSLFAVAYVPLHMMFAAVSIMAVAALLIIYFGLPPDMKKTSGTNLLETYGSFVPAVMKWNKGLKYAGFFVLFLGFLGTIVSFFIPIYVYTEGGTLQQVILITAVFTIPALFSRWLGGIADRLGTNSIFIGTALLVPLIAALGFVAYEAQLALAFLIGVVTQLVTLSSQGIVTRLAQSSHYGRVEGAMQVIETAGSVVGPTALGAAMVISGESAVFMMCALVAAVVLFVMVGGRVHLEQTGLRM
ncbi:MAG: MFS transporter [Candidatus Aenigmatarchaeota archaeon]|nr:MAG: MFS transporter [Candidatus Aenigmarchaeota archaeon]